MSEMIDNYTKLLLHFDGVDGATSDIDYSGNNHILTFNGNAQLDTAQKKFNPSSVLFDGTGDYIDIATSSDWEWAGDFTIDCWIRLDSLTDHRTIIGNQYYALGINGNWAFNANMEGNVRLTTFNGQGDEEGIASSNGEVVVDTWYHIALVRNSNTVKIYKDGTEIATGTITKTLGATTPALQIGYAAYGTRYFDGWVDELRISKGIARWTSNFTPNPYPYNRCAKMQNF